MNMKKKKKKNSDKKQVNKVKNIKVSKNIY